MQAGPAHSDFAVVWDVWRRRKWLIVLIFTGVLTTALSVTVFLPEVYSSSATILVERQQVPEAFVQSTVTSDVDIRLKTITQQILSRSRLEDLIRRFHLYEELRQQVALDEVIERMRQDIALERKSEWGARRNDTTVAFIVSYKGKEPQKVAQVTNELASYYISENLRVREKQATGTAEFLHGQLEEIKGRLEAEEQRLSQFKENYMGELPEQLHANIAVLERLNAQLRLNNEKYARVSEQRALLAQQLAELEGLKLSRLTADSSPEPADSTLEKMRHELAILRTRYSDRYPDVVLLQSQIAALEQLLASPKSRKSRSPIRGDSSPNTYVQQLKRDFGAMDAEIKALRTEEGNLLQSIARYQQRVEKTPRREQELQVLMRDYDTAKVHYQSLLKRQEEARLAENLEERQKGEQFRLLEPAIATGTPVQPDRRRLLLMGFVVAIGLAVGAAMLAEQLDSSFHTAEALRAFSPVPVFVSLPYIVTKQHLRRHRWRMALAVTATLCGLLLIVGVSYTVIRGPAQLTAVSDKLHQLYGQIYAQVYEPFYEQLASHVQHLWK